MTSPPMPDAAARSMTAADAAAPLILAADAAAPLILAADAAQGEGGGACLIRGAFRAERQLGFGKQAEHLSEAFRELLEWNNASFHQAALLAAGVGPGSFTGVRIGLSYLLGLHEATNAPLVGVNGFVRAAFAAVRAGLQGPFEIRIPAGRGTAYSALLDDRTFLPLAEPAVLTREAALQPAARFTRLIIAADRAAAEAFGAPSEATVIPPRLSDLAQAAFLLRGLSCVQENDAVIPCYVRPPDAKPPVPRAPDPDAPRYRPGIL